MKLEHVKIVLVGTTHPGNIGAAARAMRNMCISRLSLVDPQCPVGEIAYARASGANSILDNRETWADLGQAIADCNHVIALSARRRSLAWPTLAIDQFGEMISGMDEGDRVALVFGREHSGLTNDEIQLCNYMLAIPTNPDFSSLNLAAAVQVICYEIFRQRAIRPPTKQPDAQDLPATSLEVEGYFEHLHRVLETTGFIDPEHPGQIMQRLRRLYLRNELTHNEINILRGMLTAIDKRGD